MKNLGNKGLNIVSEGTALSLNGRLSVLGNGLSLISSVALGFRHSGSRTLRTSMATRMKKQ